MRIAQLPPLYESVPPALYGGTERVVSYLTEELVKDGHDVTLFASGDSITAAHLVPMCEASLRLDSRCSDAVALHFVMMEEVLRRSSEFDVIHAHIDYPGFTLGRRTKVPVVTTLHGRLDLWEHGFLFQEYRETPLISISKSQRSPVPDANWVSTVYHGLPEDLYTLSLTADEYLVFVGRVSPEKKVDSAIGIALALGMKIKIAAKVDRADRQYFASVIEPMLDHPDVEFLGEVNDREKHELIRKAYAFLHPVDWPEPFGLSLIEAMACGTPVIARRRGSIPEVVDHGVTGFFFEDDSEAVRLIRDGLPGFSRTGCRRRFEERFLARRMAEDYVAVYGSLVKQSLRKVHG